MTMLRDGIKREKLPYGSFSKLVYKTPMYYWLTAVATYKSEDVCDGVFVLVLISDCG